jgi:hypothetical protein
MALLHPSQAFSFLSFILNGFYSGKTKAEGWKLAETRALHLRLSLSEDMMEGAGIELPRF